MLGNDIYKTYMKTYIKKAYGFSEENEAKKRRLFKIEILRKPF